MSKSLRLAEAESLLQSENPRDSWFDGEGASTDFMSTREQPAVQEREGF